MRLLVASDDNQVVAVDDLDPLIEHGTLNVRIDAAATVLAAIRSAVAALTPSDSMLRETDPVRQEYVAQQILGVAAAAKALAESAPAGDKNADTTWGALYQLHLVDSPIRPTPPTPPPPGVTPA